MSLHWTENYLKVFHICPSLGPFSLPSNIHKNIYKTNKKLRKRQNVVFLCTLIYFPSPQLMAAFPTVSFFSVVQATKQGLNL